MRVTILKSRQAAPDGVNVVSLIAGEQYDLPEFLALRYIERGIAEAPKAKGPAPENKAQESPPENKAPARAPRRRKGSGTV